MAKKTPTTTKATSKRGAQKPAEKPAKKPPERTAKKAVAEPKLDLAQVRAQIDGIDLQIQQLIAERANWAHQVGRAKGKLAAAVDY